jgi:hypothetical protein
MQSLLTGMEGSSANAGQAADCAVPLRTCLKTASERCLEVVCFIRHPEPERSRMGKDTCLSLLLFYVIAWPEAIVF